MPIFFLSFSNISKSSMANVIQISWPVLCICDQMSVIIFKLVDLNVDSDGLRDDISFIEDCSLCDRQWLWIFFFFLPNNGLALKHICAITKNSYSWVNKNKNVRVRVFALCDCWSHCVISWIYWILVLIHRKYKWVMNRSTRKNVERFEVVHPSTVLQVILFSLRLFYILKIYIEFLNKRLIVNFVFDTRSYLISAIVRRKKIVIVPFSWAFLVGAICTYI